MKTMLKNFDLLDSLVRHAVTLMWLQSVTYQISILPEPDPTLGSQEDKELSSKENPHLAGNLHQILLQTRNPQHIASLNLLLGHLPCNHCDFSLFHTSHSHLSASICDTPIQPIPACLKTHGYNKFARTQLHTHMGSAMKHYWINQIPVRLDLLSHQEPEL